MGVRIAYVDRPCGHEVIGCFNQAKANLIQIRPGLPISEHNFAVLHELAHVQQHRDGLPSSECAADGQAALWGGRGNTTYECIRGREGR